MSQYIRVLNSYEQIYENIHITKQYERMSEYIRIKNGMNGAPSSLQFLIQKKTTAFCFKKWFCKYTKTVFKHLFLGGICTGVVHLRRKNKNKLGPTDIRFSV